MIPIIYPVNATTWTSNGLGGLADAISCSVKEERNGAYTLSMVYPVDGLHFSEIENGSPIKVWLGPTRQWQVFRVSKITKPLSGQVKIEAEHLSYQLSLIPTAPFTASNVSDALDGFATHAAVTCPFSFYTNKATVAAFSVATPASIRSCLGGTKGSILDVYGGEFEFDNYDVHLWNSRGIDKGVSIRYGKNLTDINQEANIANTITGIYPYYNGQDGYVELPEKVLASANAGNFPFARTVPKDFTQDFSEAPTENELRTKAQAYLAGSGIGIPSVSIKVKFVALGDTEEYKDRSAMESVELCDTVTVIYEKLGVSTTAKVTKTEWDVLAERYDSVEIGDIRATLAQTIATTQEEAEKAVDMTALDVAVQQAGELITGVKGGYVRFMYDADGHPTELLIMDTDNIATATNVWRYNAAGWGFSDAGYSPGNWKVAATIDGGIVADIITAGTLTGLKINNGNGTFYVDSAGQVTARSINITGGSVNINGVSDQSQIIQLNYYSGNTLVNRVWLAPGYVEVGGAAGIAKVNPANLLAQEIYYVNGVSQLRSADVSQYGLYISDSGTGVTANYNAGWYQQLNKLYNTGTLDTQAAASSVSISTATWVTATSVGHQTGTYLVIGSMSYSSNATGYRTILITTSSTGSTPITNQARVRVAAVNGTETTFQCCTVIKATSNGTWYMRGYQTSGTSLNITSAELRIIKICD